MIGRRTLLASAGLVSAVALSGTNVGHFAALPLPDIAASVTEAVRALDELHADGVTLLSNAAGTYLGNLVLAPLLTVLNDRSARVFVHPTSPPNANVVNLGRPAPLVEFLFDSATRPVPRSRVRSPP